MTHTTKTRTADPAPWFCAWPGIEQGLTLGLTSGELALWYTLRLKFWATGCRPMSAAMIERVASMQAKVDNATDGTAWTSAILDAERGLESVPGEGWVFPDLLEQHAKTIAAKAKASEAGRRGGQVKRTSTPTSEARPGNGDPGDF